MFIIAAAGIFGFLLIRQQVPMTLVEGLMSLTTTPWVVLLVINVILLILGCFMEAIAIMLLTIPVFMPLIARVGVDPVHFGVVLTLNLMIGLLTPPVGMCLYAVSAISKVPLWPLAKELWPYIVALTCEALLLSPGQQVLEVTGYRAGAWRKLAGFWTAPGFATELMHLYLATDLVAAGPGRLAPDADEALELVRLPLGDALAAADRGDILDAKTLLGILWLGRRRGT